MLLIPTVLCCCQGVSKFKRTGLDKLTNNLILWVSSHSSLLLALHWFRWVVQIVILYPTGWKENNFSWKLQLWCTYILKINSIFTTVLQSIIKMFTKHSQETSPAGKIIQKPPLSGRTFFAQWSYPFPDLKLFTVFLTLCS